MCQTINLSTRVPRISRFHFPAKVAKNEGPGGTQDPWGLGTEGRLVLNNTLTL